jgi:hypothetical protein
MAGGGEGPRLADPTTGVRPRLPAERGHRTRAAARLGTGTTDGEGVRPGLSGCLWALDHARYVPTFGHRAALCLARAG